MSRKEGTMRDGSFFFCLIEGKTFQNRSVSSPAPVTIVYPSGLTARYSTRKVCPVKDTIFFMLGYFHSTTWFWLYPCVLTSSFTFFENSKLHTCEPVSVQATCSIVSVFQNRMHRSAVPPPLARSPCWCGDHAIAFTAATWLENRPTGDWLF